MIKHRTQQITNLERIIINKICIKVIKLYVDKQLVNRFPIHTLFYLVIK